jgi:hypothetical protein
MYRAAMSTRWLAWAGLLGLGALFVGQMYEQAIRAQGNDLTVYLAAARALAHGQSPYAIDLPQGFADYPLTIAAVVLPLTWLPAWLAQLVWFAVNVAALVGSLVILDRLWAGMGDDRGLTWRIPFGVRLAGLVLVLLIPLRKHLYLGQVSLVVLGLCCLFLRAHLADRRLTASMWLGAAIALKLTPLLLLVSLLRQRQLRMLWLTLGWVIVWAVVLPGLLSGRVLELYRDDWLRGVVAQLDAPAEQAHHTLAAFAVQLWPGLEAVPGLPFWAAAAVVGPILWAQGRLTRYPRGHLVTFGLYLVAIPLISPLSWSHHLVVLAAPLWIWALAAGEGPGLRALDAVGAVLFLAGQWLRVPARPPGFAALGLIGVYVALATRAIHPGRPRRLGC